MMPMQMMVQGAALNDRILRDGRHSSERRRRSVARPAESFDPYAEVYGNQRMSKIFNASAGEIVPPDHTITKIDYPNIGGERTIIFAKKTVPRNLSAMQFG